MDGTVLLKKGKLIFFIAGAELVGIWLAVAAGFITHYIVGIKFIL